MPHEHDPIEQVLLQAVAEWHNAQLIDLSPPFGGNPPSGHAVSRVIECGQQIAPLLEQLLTHHNARVAAHAAYALGRLGASIHPDTLHAVKARQDNITVHSGSFRWTTTLGAFAVRCLTHQPPN